MPFQQVIHIGVLDRADNLFGSFSNMDELLFDYVFAFNFFSNYKHSIARPISIYWEC